MTVPNVGDAAARALDAYAALASLGEEIEDEWLYVTALSDAWRERLETVAAGRAADPLDPDAVRAIDVAIEEVERISDPHRAIDWLSTFPQVVLLAVGEEP